MIKYLIFRIIVAAAIGMATLFMAMLTVIVWACAFLGTSAVLLFKAALNHHRKRHA